MASLAFALVTEIFETEPTDRYETVPALYTMSIFEYNDTVYALANNIGPDYVRINITDPYDVRLIHNIYVPDLYGTELLLRDSITLSLGGSPYTIFTSTYSSSGSHFGRFHVLNYPYGFESTTYGNLSVVTNGTEYTHLQYPRAIGLVTLGEYTYALVTNYYNVVYQIKRLLS